MKKKALSVVLSVSMALGLLAAVPMSAGADEVEEITWMFWDDPETSEDLISKGFGEVVERFNTDYEGKYHVTMITTQLEEYYTQLNALVAAGETPDVFIVSPGPNLTDYVAPGVAAPLDEYLEADGWKETFSSDALFSQMTYDDQIYAVPLNIDAYSTTRTSSQKQARKFRPPMRNSLMHARRSKTQDTLRSPSAPVLLGACPCWLVISATEKV